MGQATEGVSSWTVAQVCDWLAQLELPEDPVIAAFRHNAVCGAVLADLSDGDLAQELECKPLQVRKIRMALAELGVTPPAGGTAGGAPDAPAPAAVPAPAQAATLPQAPPTPAASTVVGMPAASAASAPPLPPAAAAAGAGLGLGQEPDPRTCFAVADLRRHQQLQDRIAELQALQIPSKLAQAKQHAGSIQQQLAAVQHMLPASRKAVEQAQAQFQKRVVDDKWYPGKIILGKERHKDKQEAADDALKGATQRLQQQEQQATELQAQLAEAQKQLAAWQGKDAELATAQRTLVELTERMFAAPAWRASPRLNELADASRALDGQLAEAGRGAATYGRGTQLLTGAVQKLQEALEALSRTQMVGALNMGRGMGFAMATGMPARRQPGRQIGNMVELAVFRRANDSVAQAARDTAEARGLLPGLPQVDTELLKAARAGLFQNILFGGMASDMIQMAAVRRSMDNIRRMLSQVQAAASWAQSNLAVYQQQEAGLRSQAAAKRGEVEAYRKQALAAALAAESAAAEVVPPSLQNLSLT